MSSQSNRFNRPCLRLLCLCLALCMLVAMLPATAIAAAPKYLYMTPNSNWKVDNARFAAYFFGNGEMWVSGEKVDTDLYKFEVPAGYPSVIFCRMNPSTSANNWNNKWNQTADLTVPTNGNNCYAIKSGTWDKGGGTWSTIATCKYEGHSGSLSYVPGNNGTHTQEYSCCGETYGAAEPCTSDAQYPCYAGNCVHCGGTVPAVPHESDAEFSCQAGSCKICGETMSEASHSWSSKYPCQDAVCTICGIDMPKADHQWKDATCEDAKTCSVCGETEGEALGHEWVDGTCYQAKSCSVCGKTDGGILPHDFIDEKCKYCGLSQYVTIYFQNNWNWSDVHLYAWYSDGTPVVAWPGAAMEVYGNDGTYDVYVGKIPYDTYGVIINGVKDDGSGATDQTPDITEGWYDGICYYMFWENGNQARYEDINVILPPCEHIWKDATCNAPETCELCGAISGVALGHTFSAPTCTEPETCGRCGITQGEALGHSWADAVVTDPTCTEDGYTTYTCSVCGDSYVGDEVDANGHSMANATCTDPAFCLICGYTEGEPAGHGHQNGFEYIDRGEYHEVWCDDCWDYFYEEDHTFGEDHYCLCGGAELFTITFMNGDQVWDSFERYYDTWVAYVGMDYPTKEGHTFTGWYTADGVKIENKTIVTGNMVVYADFKVNTYTVTWIVDGAETEETYEYGQLPAFVGSTDKANDGCTVYTFAGWDNEIVEVTDNATYTAIYTESVVHEDKDGDGLCDFCTTLTDTALLQKVSASLKGNIALNYYMLLSDEALADETAYMQFTMADGEIIQIPVSQGVAHELEGKTYYVFTCAVNAKEMTDTVLSQFFYKGGATREHPYSVQTYAKHILDQYEDEATRNLIISMLNYGAASQLHFGYNTDSLANAGLETPDYSGVTVQGFNAVSGQGTQLVKLYSASLILKSETTLRFFFRADSSVENLTVTYNGQPLEVKERSGLYYVDVVGISAKRLDESVTVTVNDGTDTADVSFNPMSYSQGVLNDTTGAFGQAMRDLVSALYLYNQAANVYFKEG